MSKKLFSIFSILLIAAFVFAACAPATPTAAPAAPAAPAAATAAPAAPAGNGIKIGLSFSDFATERWKNEDALLHKLLEAKGYTVITAEANHDVKLQNDQIDNMVTQGVKGLIVVAEDGDAAATSVDKAAKAGVKIIAYDRLIKSANISAYLSFNNVAVGNGQADGVLKALNIDGGKWTKDNPAKVVLLGGSPTDNNAILFRKGQTDTLQKYIDSGVIKIVADQWVDNWDAANAEKIMENIITAQKNQIDAVVASNDGTALGALQALKAQKIAVPISGQDATADGCNSIMKGELTVTIFKDIRLLSPLAANTMDSLLQGKTVDGLKSYTMAELTNKKDATGDVPCVFLPVVEVTKANMDDVIVKSGFQTSADVYRDLTPPGAAAPAATTAPAAPAATATPAAAAPSVSCPSDKVKIVWWHISTVAEQKAYYQKVADDYTAKNPNVCIEITVLENEAFKTKLTTVMQSGNPPDLFQSWGGGVMNEYAKAGLLKDITADVSGDWKASFAPGALAVYSANGVQYGVPHDMGMVGFWYNKDLFAKAKIANPPTTWKEFLADVKALKASGTTPISLGEADNWQGAFWYEYLATRIGGKDAFQAAYSRKGKFTDQPFIDAGKDLADLVALQPFQNGFLGLKQGDQAKAVGNGDAAMELMGQWAPSTENDNSKDKKGLGDKLGFFAFPMVEGGKGNAADALGGGNGWTVGKNAPKETTDFLKFLTSKDEQIGEAKLNMGIPVVKGGETGLSDPNMIAVQKGFASAPYFQLYWDQATTPALGDVINQSVAGLFAGTSKPEDVAKAIEASAAMELAK